MSRDHYSKLQAQLKDIDQRTNKLNEERYLVHQTMDEVERKIIAEEKLLQATTWKFDGFQKLVAAKCSEEMPALATLAEGGYHCSMALTKEVSLFFDDGEVSLFCKVPAALKNFIKDYNLNVDISPLKKEVKELRQKLIELEDWVK